MAKIKSLFSLCVVVLLAWLAGCEGPLAPRDGRQSALNIVVEGYVAQFDEGRVYVRGPTNRDLTMEPGTTDTIADLSPGTYTVALEGLVDGAVEAYGERAGVQVEAGATASVTVTLSSFVPGVSSVSSDYPGEVSVSFSSVANSGDYRLQWDTDPSFGQSHGAMTSGTHFDFTVVEGGVWYVRVRGESPSGLLGAWSSPDSVYALPSNPIAFSSDRSGMTEIWLMSADDPGGNAVNLTNGQPGAHPTWSPDGTQIAFHADRDGDSYDEIYKMNADGSGVTRLTTTGPRAFDSARRPDWSPDGRIAFDARNSTTGDWELYVMADDGTNLSRLVSGVTENRMNAAWSPSGQEIAFDSNRSGSVDIWVVNADGSNARQLTSEVAPVNDRHPDWSLGGSTIAFIRTTTARDTVYVMDANGSNPQAVTGDPNDSMNTQPAWSTVNRIAFASDRDGDLDIYIMNADGSNMVSLTANTTNDAEPAWWRR